VALYLQLAALLRENITSGRRTKDDLVRLLA
jgi:hypothetical protein